MDFIEDEQDDDTSFVPLTILDHKISFSPLVVINKSNMEPILRKIIRQDTCISVPFGKMGSYHG